MATFKFRLEVVLHERKRQEDLKLREWMLTQRILRNLLEELHKFQDSLAEAFRNSDRLPPEVSLRSTMESFISGTKIRIQWKKAEIARAEKFVEKARLVYVAASQKRAVIDKLKEKRFAEYKKENAKRALKELDDIYVMRAIASDAKRTGDEQEISAHEEVAE